MIRKLIPSILSSALLVATAHAQTVNNNAIAEAAASGSVNLYTSPLYSDAGQSYHACNVANIYKSAITITVQLLSSSGTVIRSSPNVVLAAGVSLEVADGGVTGFARCQITTRSASYVRANETVFHYTGSYYDSIAFSEAR